MPCKYVFYDGEEIVESYGNLASCDITEVPTGQDLKGGSIQCNCCYEALFIDPIEKLRNKPPETTSYGDF